MTLFRKRLGQSGEDLACRFLKKQGYKILGRNLRYKFGEIDILAEDGEDIVLVEVKTKTSSDFGQPFEEVDYFKKKKLEQLCRFLTQKYPEKNIRVDVVSIEIGLPAGEAGERPKIEHLKNAVEF